MNTLKKILTKKLSTKIMFLDGAMGTMIQQYKLEEEDFQGIRFKNHSKLLKGNNDLLSIVKPEIIKQIHTKYMEAGANIIETNTFNATSISQKDYDLSDVSDEINRQSAIIAREAIQTHKEKNPGHDVYLAGAIGPTNTTASMSPDVNDPGKRNITYDQLKDSYYAQAKSLVEGGVDLFLIETIFDTLNAKAAIHAVKKLNNDLQLDLPIMLSVTITDNSGRTLSGQTLQAFWNSVRHATPISVGINCAFGAKEMRPYIKELSTIADCFVSCYPNAGLPNPLAATGYDELPEDTALLVEEFAQSGFINLIGGCCGTTPDHIRAMVNKIKNIPPRIIPAAIDDAFYSGLEPLNIKNIKKKPFLMIGERTNVMGSPKFSRLIKEGNLTDALEIARNQVQNGANVIDICFDEGLLDAKSLMQNFLRLIASEPDISRVPIMIDSSKWEVLEEGLKNIQGKGIVNSISLKEGEAVFLEQAKTIQSYGAAVVVMAFDEKGQAASLKDKVRICKRAYDLLTQKINFNPRDIIFDPNVLTVATGMQEHNNYAKDFIDALSEIKAQCPGALTSGGISNVSFSFRGNNRVREAMHSSFLFHAIKNGLDMGIVNAGMIEVYEEIDEELLEKVEDVLLNKTPEATEALLDFASSIKGEGKKAQGEDLSWRKENIDQKISHALVKGINKFVDEDTLEALDKYKAPLNVIEGPLMEGMKKVGVLFGDGKMFLPQVVKSARVMKQAVAILEPMMDKDQSSSSGQGVYVIATVKGDVHDIGKNIVSVVLSCNGYKVVDLGVMVQCSDIIKAINEYGADIVGLSGLITPSLDEMISNAKEFSRAGINIPLMVGGATTSNAHTALKIAPAYDGPTIRVGDASLVVEAASNMTSESKKQVFLAELSKKQENLRKHYLNKNRDNNQIAFSEACENKYKLKTEIENTPNQIGVFTEKDINLEELSQYIDWSPFFWAWELKGTYPKILEHKKYGVQATTLFEDAKIILNTIIKNNIFKPSYTYGIFPAKKNGEDAILYKDLECKNHIETLHFLRQQDRKENDTHYYSLIDFLEDKNQSKNFIGAFCVTAGYEVEKYAKSYEQKNDDYTAIIIKAIGDRFAEALAEMLHHKIRLNWNSPQESLGLSSMIREKYQGIRPAPGYPACPDHSEKKTIWNLLEIKKNLGIELTESCAINPPSSITGLYFEHPEAKYFMLGKIGRDQVSEYAKRKGISIDNAEKWLGPNLDY
jgi:5-methyltetrahydrofolate--homocysteine methyltransferase